MCTCIRKIQYFEDFSFKQTEQTKNYLKIFHYKNLVRTQSFIYLNDDMKFRPLTRRDKKN